MTNLEIISKLCDVCTDHTFGIFEYDGDESSLALMFGPTMTIKANKSLKKGRYIYDYERLLSCTPDVCIFTENAPYEPIDLYCIEEN